MATITTDFVTCSVNPYYGMFFDVLFDFGESDM